MSRDISDRIRALAAESSLDAVICLSPENVAYTAGFAIPSHSLMRWRHAATVLTASGEEIIVCVDMEQSTVRANRPDAEVRVWAEFTGNAMQVLADVLREHGLARGRLGIETDYISVDNHAEIVERLPEARFVPVDELLERSRQLKTTAELELLTKLARISDRAIGESFAAVRAGCSEMDIAATLTRSVYAQGAHQFKLLIIASGERSQLPNVGPSTRVLQPGDVCRVEIFSVIDGYHAGVCRTAVVGDPPPRAEEIYANLVECKRLVLDAIRPGASSCEIYKAFRAEFDHLGLEPISFVGHGIGINLHEKPYLGSHSDQLLEASMVFGIEPLAYRTGHGFGMQIKDMVAVEPTGAKLLSDVTDTDTLYRIEA